MLVAGVADFTFQSAGELTIATTAAGFDALHGGAHGDPDLVFVRSAPEAGADAAARAIVQLRPDLHAYSNADLVQQFNRNNFAYFRQISTVLSTTTALFTACSWRRCSPWRSTIGSARSPRCARSASRVSASSRCCSGSRRCWSAPADCWRSRSAWLFAVLLDGILRRMPGLPERLHFFVFEPRALVLHAALLVIDGTGRGGLSGARRRGHADRGDPSPRGDLVTVLETRQLRRSFPMAAGAVEARARHLGVRSAGEYVAITGPSGCGKSTLLHLLGCVDVPTSGSVMFEGRDVAALSESERCAPPPDAHRLRLPAVLPAADAHGVRERRAAAGRSRRRRGRSAASAPPAARLRRPRRRARTTCPRSSRAARCSASRSPARSPTGRRCCSPTSRPASSTRRPATHIAELFDRVNADGTAIVLVTHNSPLAARATRQLTMRSGTIQTRMIIRLALRSLATRPLRTAVLASGSVWALR